MVNDLRPRCGQKSGSNGVSSRKGACNHYTVEHSNEENLRVKERAKGVNEGVEALAPLHLAVEHGDVVPKRSRLTQLPGLIPGDAI